MYKNTKVKAISVWISVWMFLCPTVLAADPPKKPDDRPVSGLVAKEPDPATSTDRSKWKIREAEPAIERARTIVGIKELRTKQASAELTVLEDDLTPCLHNQIVNRPLWHVTINDWSVKLASFPEARDDFKRTLDVYIDPVDGKLLKLETRWPEGEPHLIGPRPAADVATKQVLTGGERHHGFPSEPPAVSFLDALDNAVARSDANPFLARQIFGHYVIQSEGPMHKPSPVWSITLWGIPPYYLYGRAETNDPIFVLRYIVDARTGRWRSSITNPYWTTPGDQHD